MRAGEARPTLSTEEHLLPPKQHSWAPHAYSLLRERQKVRQRNKWLRKRHSKCRSSWPVLISVGFKQFLHFCVSGCLWLRKGILPVSDLLFSPPGADWNMIQKNLSYLPIPSCMLRSRPRSQEKNCVLFLLELMRLKSSADFFLTISLFPNLSFQLLSITKSFFFMGMRKSWCSGTRTIASCCTVFPRAQAVWDWVKPSLGRAGCALAIFYLTGII